MNFPLNCFVICYKTNSFLLWEKEKNTNLVFLFPITIEPKSIFLLPMEAIGNQD